MVTKFSVPEPVVCMSLQEEEWGDSWLWLASDHSIYKANTKVLDLYRCL
jgi:hypothetical protein